MVETGFGGCRILESPKLDPSFDPHLDLRGAILRLTRILSNFRIAKNVPFLEKKFFRPKNFFHHFFIFFGMEKPGFRGFRMLEVPKLEIDFGDFLTPYP